MDPEESALQVRPGCAAPEPPRASSARASRRRRSLPEQYVDGILRGDRAILAQAITLIESSRAADRELAEQIVEACLPIAAIPFAWASPAFPARARAA